MRLSVVVTIVEGAGALRASLEALARQEGAPELEVLVPWDASVEGIGALERDFPSARFLALGRLQTERSAASPAGQHELFDRRRSAGLAAATGELVAILEDRGVPRSDWAATAARLFAELPHRVIGGAIENGRSEPLAWAVYFCDFGRYQLPFEPGPREWVSDVNVVYRREVLEETRALWRERYHETTVHWELARRGETLFLHPDLVVVQRRGELRSLRLLAERFHWGRLFACTRAREVGRARRAVLASLAPALPFVLLARHARTQAEKRVALGRFLAASPLVLALLVAWSAGELAGYVTRRP